MTAPNMEPPRALAGVEAAGQERTDSRDSASDGDAERKLLATLQAVAAIAGVRVDPIEDDEGHTVYVITRWALTAQRNTLDDVREFLQRMGIAA